MNRNPFSPSDKPGQIPTFKPIEGFFFLLVMAISVGLLATPYYAYSVVPAFAILFLFLIGRRPQWGYYLIIFLIPFDVYRGLTESYRFLTISKLVGLWLFIFILFYFLFKKRLSADLKSNLWPWLIIFFVISLVAALLSDYRLTAFNALRQLLTAYIFFALTLIFVSRRGFLKIFPAVIIASMTISSILSIIGYVLNIQIFAVNIETLRRATGPSTDPNFFSSMAIFSIPFIVHWFFSSHRLPIKVIALFCLSINMTAVVLTYSRGGALVLAIVLVLLTIEHLHRFRPIYLGFIISILMIALAATLVVVPSSYWTRQKSTTVSDESVGARISYLKVGWKAFKEDPVLGSGPGTFKDLYGKTLYAFQYHMITAGDDPKSYKRYSHNTYVEVLVGTGILGFVVFIAVLLLSVRNLRDAGKSFAIEGYRDAAALVGSYKISLISMLLYFLLISAIHHKYFWVSLALSQVALKIAGELKKEESGGGTVLSQ